MVNVPSDFYILSAGLFTERFSELAGLRIHLTAAAQSRKPLLPRLASDPLDAAQRITVKLVHPDRIQREDRSVLNTISTLVLNAVEDAVQNLRGECSPDSFADAPIFIGSDGPEHDFSALAMLVHDTQAVDSVYTRLGDLRTRTNPLELLRSLTTNAAYHASKRLGSHGGAYPLRAASLSGLVALEEALSTLECGAATKAIVIAAGNMRSVDSLVTFNKLGLISNGEQGGKVIPSFGAACLLLQRGLKANDLAFARVLSAGSFFEPSFSFGSHVWGQMFDHILSTHGSPDILVSYGIGMTEMDRMEESAATKAFPEIPRVSYKGAFGYTGKANNLLDLVAAISDPAVGAGKTVLITGAGLGYGVGFILLEKTHDG